MDIQSSGYFHEVQKLKEIMNPVSQNRIIHFLYQNSFLFFVRKILT